MSATRPTSGPVDTMIPTALPDAPHPVSRLRELLLHAMVLVVFVESLGVGPVTTGRFLAVVAAVVLLVTVLGRPSTPSVPHPWVLVPAGLLTAWTLTSGIWVVDRAAWLEAVQELALALIFLLAYSVLIDSRALIRRLLISFAAGATAVAPIGLWQVLQGDRAVGLQGDPNTYALYQLAALPIAAHLMVRARGEGRLGWALSCVLLVASVLAAQSRGAALGLVVVLAFLMWTGAGSALSRERRAALTVAGGVVLVGAGALLVALLPRFDLDASLEDGGTGRLDIWRSAAAAWWDQPLLGLGAGGYEAESGRLLSQTPGVDLDPRSELFEGIRVHNSFLEPLVELGPVGLALVVMLLAGIGLVLERERRRHGCDLVAALVPMLLAFLASAIFLSVTTNKLLWMLAGFAAVLPYLSDPPARRRDDRLPRGNQ